VQAYTVELANAVCEDLLLLVFASSGKVIMLSLINKPREKILGIVGAINIFEEPDSAVWTFNSNGIDSVQSLYAVIGFRGVQPIHTPVVWKLTIPPRIQVGS